MTWPPVKLSEIVDAMETSGQSSTAYLDRQTGKVVELMDQDEFTDYDEDEMPEWVEEQVALVQAIEADEEGRFVELPDKFDVDEWRIMADFAAAVEDEHISTSLSQTIRGSGAFRRFKDMAAALGVLDEWFTYRDGRYREVAKEWCEAEGVEWEEGQRRA
jgi:hypothetical protein